VEAVRGSAGRQARGHACGVWRPWSLCPAAGQRGSPHAASVVPVADPGASATHSALTRRKGAICIPKQARPSAGQREVAAQGLFSTGPRPCSHAARRRVSHFEPRFSQTFPHSTKFSGGARHRSAKAPGGDSERRTMDAIEQAWRWEHAKENLQAAHLCPAHHLWRKRHAELLCLLSGDVGGGGRSPNGVVAPGRFDQYLLSRGYTSHRWPSPATFSGTVLSTT
jgi:hypothetical protein